MIQAYLFRRWGAARSYPAGPARGHALSKGVYPRPSQYPVPPHNPRRPGEPASGDHLRCTYWASMVHNARIDLLDSVCEHHRLVYDELLELERRGYACQEEELTTEGAAPDDY